MLGKGILGGALGAGVAYGGGFALTAINSLTTLGTLAAASGPAAPVVAIGGAIGLGIGAIFSLFS